MSLRKLEQAMEYLHGNYEVVSGLWVGHITGVGLYTNKAELEARRILSRAASDLRKEKGGK